MMTLAAFLKQEFNISEKNENESILVEPAEVFRVENIKKNIGKKVSGASKLRRATENVLAKNESMVDIDDEIELRWKNSFSRIRDELLNIDEALNTDKVVLKVNKKKLKAKKKHKSKESEIELTEYSWFIKLSAVCVLVLLLAVSTTTFAPNFSNKIARSVNSAFKIVQKDKSIVIPKGKIARKATISKKAMSDYIVNNQDKLKDLKSGDVVETDLGGQKKGRVAGVMTTNNDKESFFMLFLKKLIKFD